MNTPFKKDELKKIDKKIICEIAEMQNICAIKSVVMVCERKSIDIDIKKFYKSALSAKSASNRSKEIGFTTLDIVYAILSTLNVNILFHFDVKSFKEEEEEYCCKYKILLDEIHQFGIKILKPARYCHFKRYVENNELPIIGFLRNGCKNLAHMSPLLNIDFGRFYFALKDINPEDGKERNCTSKIKDFFDCWYKPKDNYGNCIVINKRDNQN